MIDNSTLLQVNATIISGLLILFSLSTIWITKTKEPIEPIILRLKKYGIYFTPKQMLILFLPFSISAITTIIEWEYQIEGLRIISVPMLLVGFGFLVLVIIITMFSEKPSDVNLSGVNK